MPYRNGTYVAFDGNGSSDPTKGDLKYLGILRSWNTQGCHKLNFSDSHLKTYAVSDLSSRETLKRRLLERMRNSKNMLLIISGETSWDRGMLNFEIEKAVDYYEIPLIVSYVGYNCISAPRQLSSLWPKALNERIMNRSAKCIHIPFREKAIAEAIEQFSVHSTGSDILTGPLHCYSREVYKMWGYA